MNKDNPSLESTRRLHYAYFSSKNPKAFDAISRNNAILLHGTRIDAIPSILKYGMNSVDESNKNNIDLSTGEEWSRINGKRNFISFTDSLDIAFKYACKNNKNNSSFEVVIGMSPDSLNNLDTETIHSDTPEIGILNHIPLEHIKVLMVPDEKVEFVRKLVGELPIEVVGAQIKDNFYKIPRFQMNEYLQNPDKTKESANIIQKSYSKDDMKELATSKSRKLSKFLNLFGKLKEKFNNKEVIENESDYR